MSNVKKYKSQCLASLGWTSRRSRGSKRSGRGGQDLNLIELKVRFQLRIEDILGHHLHLEQREPERPDRPDPRRPHPSDQLCRRRGPRLKDPHRR